MCVNFSKGECINPWCRAGARSPSSHSVVPCFLSGCCSMSLSAISAIRRRIRRLGKDIPGAGKAGKFFFVVTQSKYMAVLEFTLVNLERIVFK